MKFFVKSIIIITLNVITKIHGDQYFDTLQIDNYTIVSPKQYFYELERIIPNTNSLCNKLIGQLENKKHVVTYFFKTKKDYIEYYKKSFGENPSTGDGGRCVIKKDTVIIFGYREIGFGSITHELVHAIIVPDWPKIPGWLNEAIAQALGAPSQSVGAIRVSKDLLEKGEYYTLKELFKHKEKEYLHHIEREKIIKLDNMKVASGIWLIGHSFVYYLKERELLGKFYRSCKNENDIEVVVKNIGFENILILQKDFFKWLGDTEL